MCVLTTACCYSCELSPPPSCSLFFLLSFFQLLALTTALCIAARPGVTVEALNYYNTPLDGFRAFVEAVVAVMWVVKVGNELQKIVV